MRGIMRRCLMSRPRIDLPDAAAIRALADREGRLALRVTPGARTESVDLDDGVLVVKVRTLPEDGKANADVCRLVARALGVAPTSLRLLRGETGRNKLIQLQP